MVGEPNRKHMDKKFVATRPKLNDCKGSLKGDWFVGFKYLNSKTGRMEPFRHYAGFRSLKTLQERIDHGKTLVARYTRKLKSGQSPENWDSIFTNDHKQLRLK